MIFFCLGICIYIYREREREREREIILKKRERESERKREREKGERERGREREYNVYPIFIRWDFDCIAIFIRLPCGVTTALATQPPCRACAVCPPVVNKKCSYN